MPETAPLSDLLWTRGYTDPNWIHRFTSQGRELSPTRRVWRGETPPRHLPRGEADLDALGLVTTDAGTLKLPDLFAAAQTDAFLVMHRGQVVYERYLHGADAHTPTSTPRRPSPTSASSRRRSPTRGCWTVRPRPAPTSPNSPERPSATPESRICCTWVPR